jgi:hypothetical protein
MSKEQRAWASLHALYHLLIGQLERIRDEVSCIKRSMEVKK